MSIRETQQRYGASKRANLANSALYAVLLPLTDQQRAVKKLHSTDSVRNTRAFSPGRKQSLLEATREVVSGADRGECNESVQSWQRNHARPLGVGGVDAPAPHLAAVVQAARVVRARREQNERVKGLRRNEDGQVRILAGRNPAHVTRWSDLASYSTQTTTDSLRAPAAAVVGQHPAHRVREGVRAHSGRRRNGAHEAATRNLRSTSKRRRACRLTDLRAVDTCMKRSSGSSSGMNGTRQAWSVTGEPARQHELAPGAALWNCSLPQTTCCSLLSPHTRPSATDSCVIVATSGTRCFVAVGRTATHSAFPVPATNSRQYS